GASVTAAVATDLAMAAVAALSAPSPAPQLVAGHCILSGAAAAASQGRGAGQAARLECSSGTLFVPRSGTS
ncbi:hypothetical protein, partial [Ideonella sp.]|uniref:hypothetical protein n=1 Tax=Ideonella sp. TaxID=1929293 RepID=UPI003BB4BA74